MGLSEGSAPIQGVKLDSLVRRLGRDKAYSLLREIGAYGFQSYVTGTYAKEQRKFNRDKYRQAILRAMRINA